MEKQLKCVLLLSLKEMALRKVVGSFWNDAAIPSSVKELESKRFNFYVGPGLKWVNGVEDLIKEKITKLLLPRSLIKQMTALIYPFSSEVKKWIDIHGCFLISISDVQSRLCWTTAGTIDYRKTAEKLICCNKLNGEKRYELACCYCMENDIPLFWKALPEKAKEKYYDYDNPYPYLPYWWPFILQGQQFEIYDLYSTPDDVQTSFNQRAFEYCCEEVHFKAASEYFLQKLTPEEREASLIKSFQAATKNRNNADLLFFLLSAMTPKQQLEAVKTHPFEVLNCFFQWPLQELFSENVDFFWTCIPPSSYIALIEKIVVYYDRKEFNFPKVFKEFFTHSPQGFKKDFIEIRFIEMDLDDFWYYDTAAGHFLTEFIWKKDSESIKVLFRSLDASDRVKTIFHVIELLYHHVVEERYELVQLCLREATLPKNEKQKMKEAFERYIETEEKPLRRKFKTIFDFLDNIDASSSELRGENCSPEQ